MSDFTPNFRFPLRLPHSKAIEDAVVDTHERHNLPDPESYRGSDDRRDRGLAAGRASLGLPDEVVKRTHRRRRELTVEMRMESDRVLALPPVSSPGGGGEIPAWVEDLRAPSNALPKFAYDFSAGGTGEGYGGTGGLNPTTLTDSEALEEDANWGNWDPGLILSGVGLLAAPAGSPVTIPSLIPAAWLTAGCTLLMEFVTPVPDTADGIGIAQLFDSQADIEILSKVNFGVGSGDVLVTYFSQNDSEAIGPTTAVSRVRIVFNQVLGAADCHGSTNGATVTAITNEAAPIPATALGWDASDPGGGAGHWYLAKVAAYDLQPSADLDELSIPQPDAPLNMTAPVVSGSGRVGAVLSCSTGEWLDAPTSYAYQWRLDGVNIGGATASTYTPVLGDLGSDVDCVVTASNAVGAGSPSTSNAITVIPAAGYQIGAVEMDGASWLVNAGLVASDSALLLRSVWLYIISGNPQTWVTDPTGDYTNNEFITSGGSGQVQAYVCNGANSSHLKATTPAASVPTGQWFNLLYAVDTNHAAGDKIIQVYINDVDVTGMVEDNQSAFSMVMNGLSLTVGGDTFGGDGLIGYMADNYIAPGQFLDLSVEVNRRKFIDASGLPVDLGSDGSTPTGTAPAVFNHIDAAGDPADFALNPGSGGAFSITGALTLAPSSPSS